MKKRMAWMLALAAGTGLGLAATPPSLADHITMTNVGGLQLSISPEATVTEAGNVALTVRYIGGNIRSIMLYIDGNLLEKSALTTDAKVGKIRFEIDPSLVEAGDHIVVVKGIDANGRVVVAKATVHFGEGGPVRLTSPMQNAVVQGVVPIVVQVDPSLSGAFVSFYVDNRFLMMKNYAPYTFNWDSTRVANGNHEIYIEVLDAQTQAVVKKIRTFVTVNNVMGFTNRQTTIPDLRNSQPSPAQNLVNRAVEATLALQPEGHLEADAAVAPTEDATSAASLVGGLRAAVVPQEVTKEHPLLALPAPNRFKAPTLPETAWSTPDRQVPAVHFAVPTASVGVLAMLAEPKGALSLNKEGLSFVSRTSQPLVAPQRIGNFAVMPHVAAAVGVGTKPHAFTGFVAQPVVKRIQHTRLLGTGTTVHRARTLQIAFDNQLIAFDVPPRVVNGMPLAPFRQIFEHTGGTVEWYAHSKTVRAINTSREIEFRIGHKTATVNDQSLKMQTAPYIDRGRAIVPISFVKDALNVNVQYDPQTGHILIQSK
ncbi:copper amine oxidase family protein [Chthonomonas calidirosea]|uniref:stalk domain-containing protein n=1 Tax=Chthonomonas calidirosea TaxID=454171 RepID=UPI0006DD5584|nr:stalk domain-containing protein [Chthonomonas calidirosea]CEK15695.1 copper amine oxidase family protein [Chthonomonas calidirosea]